MNREIAGLIWATATRDWRLPIAMRGGKGRVAHVIRVSPLQPSQTLPLITTPVIRSDFKMFEEYHLLYLLSEPHTPVVHRKPHGWQVGDILSAEKNPAFQPSDRFLVFDVSRQGRAMALKISEVSEVQLSLGEYVSLGPDGLNVPEVAMVEGTASSIGVVLPE